MTSCAEAQATALNHHHGGNLKKYQYAQREERLQEEHVDETAIEPEPVTLP